MKKLSILVALSAAVACGSTLNGTLGWVPPNDGVSFVGSSLGTASTVTAPALESINALPPLYQGAPNDFAVLVALASNVVIADPTLAVSHLNGGFFADPLPAYADFASGSRFEFDVAAVDWTSSAATNLSVLAEGTIIDHLGVFSPTAALISGSFTTTGLGGAVNTSFTLATVPEPESIVLVGLILCAMRLRRRHR